MDRRIDSLTFKAVQTYDDGTVVSWIETAPDAEHPAPVMQLTAAEEPAPSKSTSSSSSNGLAVVALIVAIVGVLAGGAGIVLGRRR